MTTITIPIDVAEAAAEALGNFVSDHGWTDSDMQAMDNLDAYIQRHKASRTELAKPAERKPMTTKELEEEFFTKTAAESPWAHFVQGARAAEAHHKIGVKT